MKTEIMAFRDYLLSLTISDSLEIWELKGIYHIDCQYQYIACFDKNQYIASGNCNFVCFLQGVLMIFLADLGHQTAQRIVHASDPLQSMQEINQNFPSVVSSLSRMKVYQHF